MSIVFNNPENIKHVLENRLHPTILMWNRLEGRPRTHHFDRALKAEVRDALWMLTKQWQMGEFKGDDAGSPINAKIKIKSSEITQFKSGNNNYMPLDKLIPMETLVERKKIPFERNKTKINLDIRLQLGNYWKKLLKASELNYFDRYLGQYQIIVPDRTPETDYLYAHKDELQQWKAASGRCMDGYELYLSILRGNSASYEISVSNPLHFSELDTLGEIFMKWFKKNFNQPEEIEGNSWLPDRLEYKFSCNSQTSEGDIELIAEEYYHGHLDWHAFDLNKKESTDGNIVPKNYIDSFIPTQVEFDGMPNKRWWKFEDHKTSFGDINPSTTDLSKLLLIEFGLIFANDWFIIPFMLPIGSISEIKGLTVTDNFGDIFWIESTEKVDQQNLDWSMFKQKSLNPNSKMFLCPSAKKVQESEPYEGVYFLKDEMANMVWAVEKTIPTITGKGGVGKEYALQTQIYHQELSGGSNESQVPYKANVFYKAMTEVPENWIPFIPVHANGHNRKIQLQRASNIRIIQGSDVIPEKIKPLTSILREGLDETDTLKPYFVHEEEVPRSGIQVQQKFERTRWLNGEVYVWLGMKKKTGAGEGSSGLLFDQIKDVKKV